MAKTVWILGAGFSKPLGGPLLTELLTEESLGKVVLTYPDVKWGHPASSFARDAWNIFCSKQDRNIPLWSDPEEYLDRLDSAVCKGPDSAPWKHLWKTFFPEPYPGQTRPTDFSLNETSDWAKRWVIAECCAFVESSDPGSERWRAHRDWAQLLKGDSSVITFNYDLAFERLHPKHNEGQAALLRPDRERRQGRGCT